MNRREVFSWLAASSAAAVAVPGCKTEVLGAGPDATALCLVVTMPEYVDASEDELVRLKEGVERAIGPKCPPVIVAPYGVTVRTVVPGGYSYREKLGDYEYEFSCKTFEELKEMVGRHRNAATDKQDKG